MITKILFLIIFLWLIYLTFSVYILDKEVDKKEDHANRIH